MPFKNQHPLYSSWCAIKQRCYNKNNAHYHNYGGRGIYVCDKWIADFHAFASDMGERPDGHSIDRIDNNGPYSPENCRWATRKEQQRNRREAVYVTIEDKKYRAIELADKIGCKTDTIIDRACRGLPLKDVLSKEPLRDLSGLSLGGKANGERQKAKTHCKHGHPFDEKNTSFDKKGNRSCRRCHANRQRIINKKR